MSIYVKAQGYVVQLQYVQYRHVEQLIVYWLFGTDHWCTALHNLVPGKGVSNFTVGGVLIPTCMLHREHTRQAHVSCSSIS